ADAARPSAAFPLWKAHVVVGFPPVPFLFQVVEDSNKELIMSLSIRAFPTFRFYLEGNQVDETRGANIQEVASKVRKISIIASLPARSYGFSLCLPVPRH
ncbi:unnamed protein product, partial [Hapterophycus canaliculatus]